MKLAGLAAAVRVMGWAMLFYLALALVLNPESRPAEGQVQFLYGLF